MSYITCMCASFRFFRGAMEMTLCCPLLVYTGVTFTGRQLMSDLSDIDRRYVWVQVCGYSCVAGVVVRVWLCAGLRNRVGVVGVGWQTPGEQG